MWTVMKGTQNILQDTGSWRCGPPVSDHGWSDQESPGVLGRPACTVHASSLLPQLIWGPDEKEPGSFQRRVWSKNPGEDSYFTK